MHLQGLVCFVIYFVAATSAVQVQRSADEHMLVVLEYLVQQHAIVIQQITSTDRLDALETKVQQQAAIFEPVQSAISLWRTKLQQLISRQGVSVAFKADFGAEYYRDVPIPQNSPVIFNRVLSNVGNGFNMSSGFFRAPVSGLYTFKLHIMGGDNDTRIEIRTEVNNSPIATCFAQGYSLDSNDQGSCTAVVHLNQSERVSAKFKLGTPILWGSPLTSFSGFLIHDD